MPRRTIVRTAVGVVVIGGILGGLWAVYRPSVRTTVESRPEPQPPRLEDTHATIRLRGPGISDRDGRATISCDGTRRRATGYWEHDPREACDALASTRGTLLSGPGCPLSDAGVVRIAVSGAFGARRFAYRTERSGGCTGDDDWLGVNALAIPQLVPDQEAEPRTVTEGE